MVHQPFHHPLAVEIQHQGQEQLSFKRYDLGDAVTNLVSGAKADIAFQATTGNCPASGQTGTPCVVPHPNPRNKGWLGRNAWFAQDLMPMPRTRVPDMLDVTI
jgi:hypothetical protein